MNQLAHLGASAPTETSWYVHYLCFLPPKYVIVPRYRVEIKKKKAKKKTTFQMCVLFILSVSVSFITNMILLHVKVCLQSSVVLSWHLGDSLLGAKAKCNLNLC